MGEIMLISQQEMERRLSMKRAIDICERAYRACGENDVKFPAKITMDLGESDQWPSYGGHINAMPAYLGYDDIVGIKWAGGFENNRNIGKPYGIACQILNDPHNGETIAFMDATHITSIRTGAASGVAAKFLSRENSRELGIIGAGLQGRMNLEAILLVRKIEKIKIADKFFEASEKYANEMGAKFGVKIIPCKEYKDVVEGSDIVLTATNGHDILVQKKWLKKGATIIAIGSYQELEGEIYLTADKLICDNWAQCSRRGQLPELVKAGKISRESIYAELGEVIAGKKPARENAEEIICSCLIGIGPLDIACGYAVYKEMKAEGGYPSFVLR